LYCSLIFKCHLFTTKNQFFFAPNGKALLPLGWQIPVIHLKPFFYILLPLATAEGGQV
jgi:hypothetical protein